MVPVSPAIRPAAMVDLRWRWLKYAGTVMTARVTGWPKNASASAFREPSTLTCREQCPLFEWINWIYFPAGEGFDA